MALVNFIQRDNDYLPGEPKAGTFYWLADNSIWFAPYNGIRKDEENGGLIRVDNDTNTDDVIEIVNTLIGGMYSNEAIDNKIKGVRSWVEGKKYLTKQDISGKADTSVVNSKFEEINSKIENIDIPSVEGLATESWTTDELDKLRKELIKTIEDVFTELFVSKQDTLVSGENIKTINGVSLLGGGDVKLPTKEYVDEKVSEYKLKWRVIM